MRKFTYISYGLTFLGIISSSYLFGQITWSGVVTDGTQPVVGANVYLQDTYFGATTDTTGAYSFTANPMDTSHLIISAIGYQTQQRLFVASDSTASFDIRLQEASYTLQGVTISAGSFEASDKHQSQEYLDQAKQTISKESKIIAL